MQLFIQLFKKSPKGFSLSVLIFVIILTSTILALAFGGSYQENMKDEEFTCKDCNVIFISLDTLRADHLSTYGYERNTSPNIDNFASKSILFENAISNATWTTPAHISLFTSLYTLSHKIFGSEDVLSDDIITLPESLKPYGYTTAAFTGGAFAMSPKSGLGRGFDSYEQLDYTNVPVEEVKKSSIHYLDESNPVFEWLKNNHDKKFFLFFHTFSVHEPYVAIKNYSTMFDSEYDGAILDSEEELLDIVWDTYQRQYREKIRDDSGQEEMFVSFVREIIGSTIDTSDPRDRQHLMAGYDGKIFQTDEFIGFFLKRLEELELFDNTIIVLLSDHGEEFWDHGKTVHGQQLYEETIHVPLIIYNPRARGGARVTQQAQLIDVMPTVLDMLEINPPYGIQGKSLLPAIKGTAEEDFNKYVFSVQYLGDVGTSVRTNEWKLIFKIDGSHELYNLISDPRERKNLIDERQDVFLELREKLFEWGKEMDITLESVPSEDILEDLMRLGYM